MTKCKGASTAELRDDCCGDNTGCGAERAPANGNGVDDQCAGTAYEAPALSQTPLDINRCCEVGCDKPCDERCVQTLATYDCAAACEREQHNREEIHHGSDDDQPRGSGPRNPCDNHLAAAFERYVISLESARCLCQSFLARYGHGCCESRPAQPDISTAAVTSATASGCHDSTSTAGMQSTRRGMTKRSLSSQGARRASKHVSMAETSRVPQLTGGKCMARCASLDGPDQYRHEDHTVRSAPVRAIEVDVEKAASHDKVSLSVEGMTCAACGNKLTRVLESIVGVSNVRTIFVVGRTTFDLDSSRNSVAEIIKTAERATAFKCAPIVSHLQHLDLLLGSPPAAATEGNPAIGIHHLDRLDKRTIRITYDPAANGARAVLASLGVQEDRLAPPRPDPALTAGKGRLYDLLTKTSLAAILTIPVVVLAWADDLVEPQKRAYVSIVLASLVQALAVPEFYIPAVTSLIRAHVVEMDLLVVISITAAFVYSVVAFAFSVAGRRLSTKDFFETSTLLITLVLLGRLVGAFARLRAVTAISLRSLQSASAMLVDGGSTREIDARLLQFGDIVLIAAHAQVPSDGVILDGSTEVDESMLTGESLPVHKVVGDEVLAGTVNGPGTVKARLTRLPRENTVTQIAQLVEEAASAKPRVQDLADRLAGYFVPVVSFVAVGVFIIWLLVGIKIRDYSAGSAASNAITYAIAVLAVSCPCALGLAVPMVLVVAGGVAARGGVVIKSAMSTEMAHRVDCVVFDKTGTLTTGKLDVVAEEYLHDDREEAASIVASLVRNNNHPVSLGVAEHLSTRSLDAVEFADLQIIPGAGVEARHNGSLFRAGHAEWLGVTDVPEVDRLIQQEMTILCVARDSRLLAVLGLKSAVRLEAVSVVRELQRMQLDVHIVSGDQATAVAAVAATVGISSMHVAARRSPAEKRIYVQALMRQGKKVLFCGDGTNDAVAIAQADVGVQLGSSSDVTRAIADVVLLSSLDGVVFLLAVSKAAYHRIVFNFVWSGVYNVLAIALAAGAFVRIRIPPAYAGLGEIVSVLPVIAAALTMARMKRTSGL